MLRTIRHIPWALVVGAIAASIAGHWKESIGNLEGQQTPRAAVPEELVASVISTPQYIQNQDPLRCRYDLMRRLSAHKVSFEPTRTSVREEEPDCGKHQTQHDRIQCERTARAKRQIEEGTYEVFDAYAARTAAWRSPRAHMQRHISIDMMRKIRAEHDPFSQSLAGWKKSGVAAAVAPDRTSKLTRGEKQFVYRLKTEYGISVIGLPPVAIDDTRRSPVTLRDKLRNLEVTNERRKVRLGGDHSIVTKMTLRELLEQHPM
jgi:anti-sigma28 factor (negative regulator of flagellin synthesis)